MRILHVAEALNGGMSAYFEEILGYQKDTLGAAHVGLVLPMRQAPTVPSAHGLALWTFDDTGRRLWHMLQLARLVGRACQAHRPDVLHLHGSFAGAACRLAMAGQNLRPAIVYCPHGWAFDRQDHPLVRKAYAAVERLLSRWTERIVCISDHEAEAARQAGLPSTSLITVWNGIADRPCQPSPLIASEPAIQPLKLLFAGRFDRQKGVDVFFSALRHLHVSVKVTVIGAATLGDTSPIEPPPGVKLTGWLPREAVQAHMAECDVLVMPSRWEGFGLSALEAMRAGKAVVASRVGGLSELVSHGHTGLLVPPDDAQAIAAALASITPQEARRMGEAGRERFQERYLASRMNAALIDVYRHALTRRAAATPGHRQSG